jgi:hypothetical protein
MSRRFTRHYSREEAKALLPEVQKWLGELVDTRDRLGRFDKRLKALMAGGADVGGEAVGGYLSNFVRFRELLAEFRNREIQLKDLDRGLVDFPSIYQGREVFLCWEQGEDDIEHWHELDGGFTGREPLEGF